MNLQREGSKHVVRLVTPDEENVSEFSMVDSGSLTEYFPETTRRLQYFAVFTATIASFSSGLTFGWASASSTVMLNYTGYFNFKEVESDYAIPAYALGILVSALPSGYLVNKVGRKPVLAFLALPMFFCWILLTVGRTYTAVIVARFLAGCGFGMSRVVVPMYVGEIADTDIRGFLVAVMQLMETVGMLFTYVVGFYCPNPIAAAANSVFPVILLVLLQFLPESPYYLVFRGNIAEAEHSLLWLHDTTQSVIVKDKLWSIKTGELKYSMHKSTLRDLFQTPVTRKELYLMLAILFFREGNAVAAVETYAHSIFEWFPQIGKSKNYYPTILASVEVVSGVFACKMVNNMGRRKYLVASSIGMSVSLFTLGTFLYLLKTFRLGEGFEYVPIALLLMLVVCFYVGYGPVAFIMMAELFPTYIKGMAFACGTLLLSFTFYIFIKIFHYTFVFLEIYVPFWIYGAVTLFSALFAYKFVPETRGLTLEQIQEVMINPRGSIARNRQST